MKKASRYIVGIILGIVCIGIGMIIAKDNKQISKKTAEESSKIVEGDNKEQFTTEKVTNEDTKEGPYANHKISASNLKAEYEEKQKSLELNNKQMQQEVLEEYRQDKESYLIETSGESQVTTYDYGNFNKELTQIARNEIYARHGYIFKEPELQEIFSKKSWYQPITDKVEQITLSEVEQFNIACLKWWENTDQNLWCNTFEAGFTDWYQFDANQTFTIDLNGDGIQEEISYKMIMDEEQYVSSCSIEVNGKVQDTIEGNFSSHIWVVDINPIDEYKELVIYDEGASNDPVDIYYYYDGEKLNRMGDVQGHLNDWDYIENQVLHAVKRYDILGTARYRCDYVLTDNHVWEEVPCDFIETNVPIIAEESINIYTKADLNSGKKHFNPGTTFVAIGIQPEQWIKVKLEDGSEGWINTEEYPTYKLGGVMFVD